MADINQIKKRISQINSIAIINRATNEVVSLLKAISGANYDFADTNVEYRGANSRFPYACDVTQSNATITFTTREFPPDLLNRILRTTATEGDAEEDGDIGALTNVTGTTVSGTGGITAVTKTVGSTLKEGTFIFKALSATTFDIYAYHDADDINLAVDEEGKVNSTVYTLTGSEDTVITELGISVTAGTTPALTEGDTAKITIRKDNLGYITADIGAETTDKYYEVVMSQMTQTGGTVTHGTFYKCAIVRGAIDNPDGETATMEITLKPVIDPDNSDKIGQFQWTVGENA